MFVRHDADADCDDRAVHRYDVQYACADHNGQYVCVVRYVQLPREPDGCLRDRRRPRRTHANAVSAGSCHAVDTGRTHCYDRREAGFEQYEQTYVQLRRRDSVIFARRIDGDVAMKDEYAVSGAAVELSRKFDDNGEVVKSYLDALDHRLYLYYKYHPWLGPSGDIQSMLGLSVSREEF